MADYWKSNERKYCDFCKCWLSDNKASIAFHENGKRHKMNVAKRITILSRKGEREALERQKFDADLRKMDEAAMRSYTKDILNSRRDITAHTVTAIEADTGVSFSTKEGSTGSCGRQVDPLRLPGNSDEDDGLRVSVQKKGPEYVPNASLWVEGKSDEGYTYFWNVKTFESVWKEPKEGFLSLQEYQRIGDLVLKKHEIKQAAEAKDFRDNVNEEVARYNRESLKKLRYIEPEDKFERSDEKKQSFKTENEVTSKEIGEWQIAETKCAPVAFNLELPTSSCYSISTVESDNTSKPSLKQFKEKTVLTLDSGLTIGTSSEFKKRKFTSKCFARKRMVED